MTATTRRRVTFAVLLAAIVLWLWQCTSAFDHSDRGEAIDVFGPWLDEDAEAFAAVLAEFSFDTGITVHYTGSNDFDSDLRQRITRGIDLPDIAVIPQPGLIAELFQRGLVTPLADGTIEAIVENYPLTREQLTVDGVAFLAPYRVNVKSLVWYRPDVFEAHGWTIPATLDDLGELVDEITESDLAPWCFTIEAGSSTGWPASDWIEDLLLRRSGPDVYQQWQAGELPFTDDAVVEAVTEFDELVLAPGRTVGGAQRILGERVEDAPAPMFGEEPSCAMYKQANFATGWFPDHVEAGPGGDVDFFVLPGVDDGTSPPLLRGGDGLIQFDDRDNVIELMTYLAGADGADAWVSRGGFLSGRDTTDIDDYPDAEQPFVELIQQDRVQVFDASDSFRSEVRDAWLAALTSLIAETGRLDELAGLDDLLVSVDDVRRSIQEHETATDDPDGDAGDEDGS